MPMRLPAAAIEPVSAMPLEQVGAAGADVEIVGERHAQMREAGRGALGFLGHQAFFSAAASRASPSMRFQSPDSIASCGITHEPPTQMTLGSAR